HHREHVGGHVADGGRDHERPGALQAARLALVQLGAAARAARAVRGAPRHLHEQGAVVAAGARRGARRSEGGVHPTSLTRAPKTPGSKDATAPASTTISSANAQIARPGTTVAMPISLVMPTRIPIRKTSIMLQLWAWRSIRNACGSCHGTRPWRSGRST